MVGVEGKGNRTLALTPTALRVFENRVEDLPDLSTPFQVVYEPLYSFTIITREMRNLSYAPHP